jgi:hypothetical protein
MILSNNRKTYLLVDIRNKLEKWIERRETLALALAPPFPKVEKNVFEPIPPI